MEPELLHTLPRLIARLPHSDARIEEFQKQLYRIGAGYSGEKYVDRYLESLELPKSSIILSDIHLSLSPGHTFQIDSLILTEQGIIIFEIKNVAGELRFMSDPHQLEQTLPSGDVNIMECPITQLEAYIGSLELWLAKRDIHIKISGRVVIASKSGKVRMSPKNAPIIYRRRIGVFLRETMKGPAIYTENELQKMSKLITQNQTKFNPFPLCEYFKVSPRHLKKGQLCSVCNATMRYKSHKQRQCTACGTIEATNYEQPLRDWFILMSDSISNRESRDFLQLKNKDDAYYAIRTLPLIKMGKSVATRYYWPKGKSRY